MRSAQRDDLVPKLSLVALDELPSLEFIVAATPLTLEPGAQFPTPGETQFYPEVTAGRPGGARE